MSISDMIVVMKSGVVQQIGRPQDVYDSPVNLFVAKFLGTPPINVFEGEVREEKIWIGEDCIGQAKGVAARRVWLGIRPEGFVLNESGAMGCDLVGVEVMGRDISVVSASRYCAAANIRSIISSENKVDLSTPRVRFDIKPGKLFLFDHETEERIPVPAQ